MDYPPFFAPGDSLITDRHQAIQQLLALLQPVSASFDRISRIAATALHAASSLVTLVDTDRQIFVGCVGLAQPWATARETPLSHSFCQYVVAAGAPLIVTDARVHPLLADNGAVHDLNVIAYAGVPFFARNGMVLGSLCVTDSQPREWTAEEIALLTDLALEVQTEIEARTLTTEQEASQAALQIVRDETEREHVQLQTLLMQFPALIATVAGPDHVFTFANSVFMQTMGRDHARLLGHTVAEAFPETAGRAMPVALDQVYATGEPQVGAEVVARYDRRGDGVISDTYFDFVFQPMHDLTERITGVIMFGTEVTAQVQARRHNARTQAYMKHALDLVAVLDAGGRASLCESFL